MKKIDTEPNQKTLIKLLRDDPLGRNADLAEFAGILKTVEGEFSLFLDAEWGNGKTFFVKQFALLLEEANPFLGSHDGLHDLLESSNTLATFNELNGYLPIYYNAWENDHWDDPLPSIATAIACQGDTDTSFSSDAETQEIITKALDAVLGLFGRSGVGALMEALSGKDLMEAYKERQTLRSAISNLVDAALPEKANTLLLIIDELDRCRPSFAMKVLEQLKNLFTSDRVVIVYSVNASQLARVVEGMYGQGFDGQRYLTRFYDLAVPLRKVGHEKYLATNGMRKTSNYFESIACDLVGSYAMTMRDMNRYLEELFKVRPKVTGNLDGFNKTQVRAFADVGLTPIMLAMKIAEPDSYRTVIQNLDAVPLYNAFVKCKEAMGFLDVTLRSCDKTGKETTSDEDKKATRLEFLEALVYVIWCNDRDNPKLQHAHSIIGDSWGPNSLSHLATIF